MGDASFLYLSQDDVVRYGGLDMPATMEDVERVLAMRHRNECIVPHKVVLRKGSQEEESKTGRINALPGYLGGDLDVGGLKWVGSFVQNPFRHGLPRSTSLIVLNSFQTGLPLAIMDGQIISAMRTGAVAGVACRYLAPEAPTSIGLVGAGVVNRTVLMAIKHTCPTVNEAFVFDLSADRAHTFAAEMTEKLEYPVVFVGSAAECCAGRDIVVTATPSKQPYLQPGWVGPGTLYLHMSGYECEFEVVKQSDKIVVDNWEDVKSRNSQTPAIMFHEGLLTDDEIHAEIAQIILGERPGRTSADERILFCPVGMGVQDLIVAKRIYDAAASSHGGVRLQLWSKPAFI